MVGGSITVNDYKWTFNVPKISTSNEERPKEFIDLIRRFPNITLIKSVPLEPYADPKNYKYLLIYGYSSKDIPRASIQLRTSQASEKQFKKIS